MKKLSVLILVFQAWLVKPQNNLCFTDVTDYKFKSGYSLIDLNIADYNFDGHADVLTLGYYSDIYLSSGVGDGSFLPAVSFSLPNSASAITSGDINNDNLIDITVLFDNNDIGIYKNLGSNTFSLVLLSTLNLAINAIEFVSANNDPFPDLLVCSSSGPNQFLFLGNGSFMIGPTFLSYQCGSPQKAAVFTDLNNDGAKDIAILTVNGDIVVHTLSPQLTSSNPYTLTGNGPQEGISTGDFNHDNLTDLLLNRASDYQTVTAFINNAQAYGWPKIPMHFAGGQAIAVGDWNSDGYSDLATGRINSDVATVVTLTTNCTIESGALYGTDYTLCQGLWKIKSADLNHDGNQDLLGMSFGGRFYSFLGKANGTFLGVQKLTGEGIQHSALTGDFNSDGKADILKYNVGGGIYCQLAKGNDFVETFSTGIPYGFSSIVTCDMNADNLADLVLCRNYPYETCVYSGDGTGKFSLAATLSGIPGSPRNLICKDLNNDGLPEIFASHEFNNSNFVSYYIFKNNGNFSFDNVISKQEKHFNIQISDLNNDNFQDLVIVGAGNNFQEMNIFLGNGSLNNFTVSYSVNGPSGGYQIPFKIVDLNLDSKPDILVTGPNGINIYEGLGNGNFKLNSVFPGTWITEIADLNKDNLPDLIYDKVTIRQNLGNFIFSEPRTFYINHSVGSVQIADFNYDSLPDILASDVSMCNYDIHYNTSAVIATPTSTRVCENETILLKALSLSTFSYCWLPGGASNNTIIAGSSGNFSLESKNLSGTCKSATDYSVLFETCNNVDQNSELRGLKVYPTITNTVVRLENTEYTNGRLTVLSITGQTVYKLNNVDPGNYEISLLNFPPGVYFFHFHTAKQNVVFKVIKSN